VYDVTDYVQLHPGGGDVILQVAGQFSVSKLVLLKEWSV
jgi:cytochrome b involved in lipid metabolism